MGWVGGIAGLFLFYLGGHAIGFAHTNVAAVLYALGATLGLAVASYLVRRWWLSMAATLVLSAAMIWPHMGRVAVILISVLFSGIAGWWATRKWSWPLNPSQAFLAIGLLVMVSLELSGLLALRSVHTIRNNVVVLAVLYLATPPWEWGVTLAVLLQSRHLRAFVRSRYRMHGETLGQIGLGLLVGVGLVFITGLVVNLESHVFNMHVVANNPFVTTPGLRQHQGLAAILIGFGVIVLAPLAEEALFRGILFGSLSNAWGYLWGSLVSAGVFGLAHLDFTLLLPLALAGVVLNAVYYRSKSLIPSTVAHMTMNAISVFAALGLMR